ncbi:MAG: DUF1697 domain-containing protein [Frankiaceae bacterium]|nr:DUF1697 domain-containing protein [Frankiaceae bacterium]
MSSVVLLRGVNLGARNRIAMADLRALLDTVGCTDVRTHLQSGNAVVRTRRSPAGLEKAVAAALVEHGLPVPVMVRTAEELARVVRDCPWEGLDPRRLQVAFLSGEPDPAAVAAIDHEALLPERIVVGERVLYLDQAPGIRSSKLNGLRLGVDMTARNWRTVLALHELASG